MGTVIGLLAGVGGLFLMWLVLRTWAWFLVWHMGRRRRREAIAAAEEAARKQARDEAAGEAAERLADHVDEEYRALCEKEGGNHG